MSSGDIVWSSIVCSEVLLIIYIFFTLIIIILSSSVLYAIYNLIKLKAFGTKSDVVFVITTFFTITLMWVNYFGKCYGISYQYYKILKYIYYLFFILQFFMVPPIFFGRMQRVFKGTPFRISKYMAITYKTLFIISPMAVIVVIIPYARCTSNCMIYVQLVPVAGSIYPLVLIALIILFIKKLFQVYRYTKDDEILIGPTTKITILSSLSILLTVISVLKELLIYKFKYGLLIGFLMQILDVYTNFVCVTICNKTFKPLYLKLCGFVDSKCRKCLTRIVNQNKVNITIKMMEKEIEMETDDTHPPQITAV